MAANVLASSSFTVARLLDLLVEAGDGATIVFRIEFLQPGKDRLAGDPLVALFSPGLIRIVAAETPAFRHGEQPRPRGNRSTRIDDQHGSWYGDSAGTGLGNGMPGWQGEALLEKAGRFESHNPLQGTPPGVNGYNRLACVRVQRQDAVSGHPW
jgi:hypothetical protein